MAATTKKMGDFVYEYDHAQNMQWLRTSALQRLVATGTVAAIVWLIYLGTTIETVDAQSVRFLSLLSPLTLVLCGLAASWSVDRLGILSAVFIYTVGVIVTVVMMAWALGNSLFLIFVALACGVTGLLIGPQAGFASALVISLGLYINPLPALLPPVPLSVLWVTVIFNFLLAAFLWTATYPTRTTLHWTWMNYMHAQQQREEAQEHRAKLAQAVKELDISNKRLKSMTFELERARRAANEARCLKAEFAANISHELRTPLNLIIGFSEMMALAPQTYGEVPLPRPYRGDVQSIYRNARHLSNLIDDVLDLSQIEAGRMGLIRAPLSLAEVIDEAINTVSTLYTNKNLWLRIHIPDDLPRVEADRTRVRQVLINLLNNASRFTWQGGVTITASADEREVTVTVTDTGVGISQQDLPKVFQEFSRLSGSQQNDAVGSGLGLAICRDFVELHGGRMGVKSEQAGGTTFTFTLPLRADLGIGRAPPAWETWVILPENRTGPMTVAVLSNEPAINRLFERYLDNYHIVSVKDETEAWNLASEQMIHALVVVAPSGEQGWLALRKAREAL
ncbi:MAG: hypothetical protein HY328_00270, partial [Chloroflexi bacterium]|nr:hypothetical protein [Chloroflexota bacterium]